MEEITFARSLFVLSSIWVTHALTMAPVRASMALAITDGSVNLPSSFMSVEVATEPVVAAIECENRRVKHSMTSTRTFSSRSLKRDKRASKAPHSHSVEGELFWVWITASKARTDARRT